MEGKNTRSGNNYKAGYVFSIIFSFVALYVANNLLVWQVPFLTNEWTASLWVLNISITLTIIFNILFLIYDKIWFRSLLKMTLNIVSILFLTTFIYVYPLDFSSLSYESTLDLIIKIVLIISIAGTFIATIVEFTRIFKDA